MFGNILPKKETIIDKKNQTYLIKEEIKHEKYLKKATFILDKISPNSIKQLRETCGKPSKIILDIFRAVLILKIKPKEIHKSVNYNWNPDILLEIIDEKKFQADLKEVLNNPIDYFTLERTKVLQDFLDTEPKILKDSSNFENLEPGLYSLGLYVLWCAKYGIKNWRKEFAKIDASAIWNPQLQLINNIRPEN